MKNEYLVIFLYISTLKISFFSSCVLRCFTFMPPGLNRFMLNRSRDNNGDVCPLMYSVNKPQTHTQEVDLEGRGLLFDVCPQICKCS